MQACHAAQLLVQEPQDKASSGLQGEGLQYCLPLPAPFHQTLLELKTLPLCNKLACYIEVKQNHKLIKCTPAAAAKFAQL